MDHHSILSASRRRLILITLSFCLGIIYTDMGVGVICLPFIQNTFNVPVGFIPWVVTLYVLSIGTLLVIGGVLGDKFKTHVILKAGIAIFMTGSFLCAFSPAYSVLLGGRFIQGVGGSLMIPNISVLIINVFPKKERGRAMGVYLSGAMIFFAVGLVISGAIIQMLNWRYIFWINLPLGIISLFIIHHIFKDTPLIHTDSKTKWGGNITLSMGIGCLLLSILLLGNQSVDNIITGLFIIGVLFLIITYKIEKQSSHPFTLNILFQNPLLVFSISILLFLGCSNSLYLFYIFYVEYILGFKSLATSLISLTFTFAYIITPPAAGYLLDRYGYKTPVIIGLGFILLGTGINIFLLDSKTLLFIFPGVFLLNSGLALILTPLNTAAISSVNIRHRSYTSGILGTVREVSNSLGMAVLIAIIFGNYNAITLLTKKVHESNYLISFKYGLIFTVAVTFMALLFSLWRFYLSKNRNLSAQA